MESQEESIYTNETDSESDNNNMTSSTNTLAGEKKDVCQVMIKKKGEDKKCEVEYVHDNSTSNMIAHLRSHNIVDNKKQKSETQQNKQTTLTEIIQSNIPNKSDKQKELNKAVVEWILLDNQPLSAPRKKGFRQIMAKVDPKFHPPSDRVIRNEIAFKRAQINVMERDKLPQSNLISTESYFEEEESGEVNNGV
ncbi:3801_t:CDS:2, partial [Racocetra fulgida]